jgi:hypothetical protein
VIKRKMAEEKKIVDLGLLEQDDEFEEFPAAGVLLIQNKTLLRTSKRIPFLNYYLKN